MNTETTCTPHPPIKPPTIRAGMGNWEQQALTSGREAGQQWLTDCITRWVRAIDWPATIDDPDGGDAYRLKAWPVRQLNTLVGVISVKLPSYWKTGKPSIRPVPDALGMRGSLSPGLVHRIASIGCELPFAAAAAELHELADCEIAAETVRVVCEELGDIARTAQLDPVVPDAFAEPARITVQIDGGRVDTDEGWREPRLARIELENADGRTHTLVLSRICTAAVFWSLLAPLLKRIGADRCAKLAFISDGAKWILSRARKHFAHALCILDFFHAAEHIHKAAAKVLGDGTCEAHGWARKYVKLLRRGRIDAVLGMLTRARGSFASLRGRRAATAIDKLLGYLRPRRDQLLYMTFRRRGWPIGSGKIESLIKQAVSMRLKRPGAWWSVPNAERMLALRCAKLTGALGDVWSRHVVQHTSSIHPLIHPLLAPAPCKSSAA